MIRFQNNNLRIPELVTIALSDALGQNVMIRQMRNLGGGCINNASKLETNCGNFFLKWNDRCEPDIFIREAESLIELKKAAGEFLTIPEVYASKLVNETPGFLVLEYLESDRFSIDNDEKLGKGLARIHQHVNSEFGFHNNNYCGSTLQNNSWKSNWTEFFRDNRLRFLLDLIEQERPLPVSEMIIYEKLLDHLTDFIPDIAVPVLIHGDLWSGNFMISEKGPALIDPASYYADREMEFGIMTMFGGFSQHFYEAYNEVNPLAVDWRKRSNLYQLYHVLNHYYLFGGGYRSQAMQIAKSYL